MYDFYIYTIVFSVFFIYNTDMKTIKQLTKELLNILDLPNPHALSVHLDIPYPTVVSWTKNNSIGSKVVRNYLNLLIDIEKKRRKKIIITGDFNVCISE